MLLALYQPDIPQNTGTILRTAACFGTGVHVIGPAGFDLSAPALRRAGLDYLPHAAMTRHESWQAFLQWRNGLVSRPRLVLLTTKGHTAHVEFAFRADDVLLLGRESSGVPDTVRAAADAAVRIPIAPGLRSLNVAVAAAIVLAEAMRQTGGFAKAEPATD